MGRRKEGVQGRREWKEGGNEREEGSRREEGTKGRRR